MTRAGARRQQPPEQSSWPADAPKGAVTLTDQAYTALEEQIVTLRLQPGEFISEHALADGLGFGRTPVREALQRLAREGLITVLPRKGILVSETDPQRQLLVLEVRREMERLLSRLGAERASEVQRQRFREIAHGMDHVGRARDDIAFMRLDRELNLLISDAAHNEYASRAMRFLHGHSRRYWYMHYKRSADLPLCARLHAKQAQAIAEGNPARAEEASDKLIDYTEAFTRATAERASGMAARPPS